ncbi:hypothetical protein EJB05_05551 [Eragrostis curvula]|uniref:Uncharacterized protein n=1 Tax=Eragrostis curvula TaxID=38414 RepID=A0A5J9WFJ1_9POAL|nr:hypothetical protein EJB05_05551 [Eragrostis curvula]
MVQVWRRSRLLLLPNPAAGICEGCDAASSPLPDLRCRKGADHHCLPFLFLYPRIFTTPDLHVRIVFPNLAKILRGFIPCCLPFALPSCLLIHCLRALNPWLITRRIGDRAMWKRVVWMERGYTWSKNVLRAIRRNPSGDWTRGIW